MWLLLGWLLLLAILAILVPPALFRQMWREEVKGLEAIADAVVKWRM